jgi:hypothetical protein
VSDNSDVQEGARFNILWSNVQTLLPALFAKSPKPVVERRYLDRDDVGRTAAPKPRIAPGFLPSVCCSAPAALGWLCLALL